MTYFFRVSFDFKTEAGITADLNIKLTDFLRFEVTSNRGLTDAELNALKQKAGSFIKNKFGLANPQIDLEAEDLNR